MALGSGHAALNAEVQVCESVEAQRSSSPTVVAGSVAEFAFLDLYADAMRALTHSISMLERLEALPPFGIEAKAFGASA